MLRRIPATLGASLFGFVQQVERNRPILAAHGDDAEICVGASGVRVLREHLFEGRFGLVQIAGAQGGFSGAEEFRDGRFLRRERSCGGNRQE